MLYEKLLELQVCKLARTYATKYFMQSGACANPRDEKRVFKIAGTGGIKIFVNNSENFAFQVRGQLGLGLGWRRRQSVQD